MISNQIQRLREDRNLSQEQFAERIGVEAKLIMRWENEDETPTITDIVTICETFKVSADYLLLEKEKKEILTIVAYVLFFVDTIFIVSLPLLAKFIQYFEFITFKSCHTNANLYLYEYPLGLLFIVSIIWGGIILLYLLWPKLKRVLKVSIK